MTQTHEIVREMGTFDGKAAQEAYLPLLNWLGLVPEYVFSVVVTFDMIEAVVFQPDVDGNIVPTSETNLDPRTQKLRWYLGRVKNTDSKEND